MTTPWFIGVYVALRRRLHWTLHHVRLSIRLSVCLSHTYILLLNWKANEASKLFADMILDTSNWESKFEVERWEVKVTGNEMTKSLHMWHVDHTKTNMIVHGSSDTFHQQKCVIFLQYLCTIILFTHNFGTL